MTDIELVRALTGNNTIGENFISFYLQSSADFIKGYCNIDAIPQGLHSTYIEIAALKVKANTDGATASLGTGIKSISSITDGNQSVSYAGSGIKQYTTNEDFVVAFGDILNRYKRMVVNKPSERPLGARRLDGSRW